MTGDVVVPLDGASLADPYPLYRQLRAAGGVAHDGRHGFWVVAGYDDVQSVLRNHDAFSSQVGPLAVLHGDPSRAMMIASDPPRHTRLRAAVTHAFRPQAVARWAPRIEAIDEARFHHADRLDADRVRPPHLAFGAGRHFCLGAHLARLEAVAVLRVLLARTTTIRRDPSCPAQRHATLVVRGWRSLPVLVELSQDAERGAWTSS